MKTSVIWSDRVQWLGTKLTAWFTFNIKYKKIIILGFDVLTAVAMKSIFFWNITPYSLCTFNGLHGLRCLKIILSKKIITIWMLEWNWDLPSLPFALETEQKPGCTIQCRRIELSNYLFGGRNWNPTFIHGCEYSVYLPILGTYFCSCQHTYKINNVRIEWVMNRRIEDFISVFIVFLFISLFYHSFLAFRINP